MKLGNAFHGVGNAQLFVFLFSELVEGQQVDFPDSHAAQQAGHSSGCVQASIKLGDNRDSCYGWNSLRHSIPHIFQNDVVVNSGVFPVFFPVPMLHIEKQQVDAGDKICENLMGRIACSLRSTVQGALLGLR